MENPKVIEVASKPADLVMPSFSLAHKRAKLKGTVYLLLDHSSSMADGQKLTQLKRGAIRFFTEAYTRNYAVGMIGFSARAKCFLGASRNFYKFHKQLNLLTPIGRTAMTEALLLGTKRLRWRRGYKALFLITDGQPLYKEAALAQANIIRAKGIDLIAVGTDGADEAFLRALHPKAALVNVTNLADSVANMAKTLPEKQH